MSYEDMIRYTPEMELEVGDTVRCTPYTPSENLIAKIVKVLGNNRYLAHEDKYGFDVMLDEQSIKNVFVQ